MYESVAKVIKNKNETFFDYFLEMQANANLKWSPGRIL